MRILLLVSFMLLMQSVAGAYFYADVVIDVKASGVSYISGRTNHPVLQQQSTEAFTSKKNGRWIFNLTLPKEDVFSNYVYEIILPENSAVNYIKSQNRFRIVSRENRIAIIGAGEREPLNVVIQYQLKSENDSSIQPLLWAMLILSSIVAVVYLAKKRKKQRKTGDILSESYASMLTERQKDILRILNEFDGPVNQKIICDKLNLPKSSVSRNINSMIRLGLIEKQRVGVSTYIILKKK